MNAPMVNSAVAQSAIPRPPILALIAVSAMSPFAINAIVPSMPAIELAFSANYARVQLILSMFLASIAISQIFIGPLSDRFGRRPVLLIGFAIFVAASLASPFAPSINWLIAIRVVQGASGCVGIVLGRAIVRDLYERREAASMLGYVTMGLAMAPMVAPFIGGVFQQVFGWQAIFLLMAALGGMCLAVTWRFIPETNRRPTERLSFGTLFRDIGELAHIREFLLFTACGSLTTGVFFAFLGGAPYVAERFLHLEPAIYGLWFGVIPMGYATGSFLAGRSTQRVGVSRMILTGSTLAVFATALLPSLSLLGFHGPAALFLPMVLCGIANGLALPSAVSGAVSIRADIAGTAAGLSGAAQIGTGAILSTAAGAALSGSTSALPMFLLMLGAASLGLVAAVLIYRRDRR